MERKIYIYALIDPNTNQCRYVGKTVDLKTRYRFHCNTKGKNYSSRWIQSLRPNKPEIVVIEEVIENWQEAEQFWIAYFKFLGAKLVNGTNGGEGTHGRKLSEETKAKISLANMNNKCALGSKRSDETKAKMSALQKGKTLSKEHIIKLSESHKGLKISEETKQKLSKAVLGIKRSEESIAKSSNLRRGRTRTEEQKKRISEGTKRAMSNPETLKRLSESHKGKVSPIKGRTKISNSFFENVELINW